MRRPKIGFILSAIIVRYNANQVLTQSIERDSQFLMNWSELRPVVHHSVIFNSQMEAMYGSAVYSSGCWRQRKVAGCYVCRAR